MPLLNHGVYGGCLNVYTPHATSHAYNLVITSSSTCAHLYICAHRDTNCKNISQGCSCCFVDPHKRHERFHIHANIV